MQKPVGAYHSFNRLVFMDVFRKVFHFAKKQLKVIAV